MTGLHDDLIDAGEQHLSNPNWMPVSRDYLSDVLAALSESDAEVARLRAELAKSDSAFSSLKQQHTAADVDLIDLRDERDELQARINKALAEFEATKYGAFWKSRAIAMRAALSTPTKGTEQ